MSIVFARLPHWWEQSFCQFRNNKQSLPCFCHPGCEPWEEWEPEGKCFLSQWWKFAEEGWTLNSELRTHFCCWTIGIFPEASSYQSLSVHPEHGKLPLCASSLAPERRGQQYLDHTTVGRRRISVCDSGCQTNTSWYYSDQNGLFCFVRPREYTSFFLLYISSFYCSFSWLQQKKWRTLILTKTRVGPTTVIQIPCKFSSKFTAKVWWEFYNLAQALMFRQSKSYRKAEHTQSSVLSKCLMTKGRPWTMLLPSSHCCSSFSLQLL